MTSTTTTPHQAQSSSTAKASPLHQPLSVWVLTFACTVSYMGLGLVDPILPTIAGELHATPGQTELLFTSYLFVTAFVMLFSAWVSHKFGTKRTLVAGVAIIVVFALGCSLSGSVNEVIGFRAGWGLGNALFVSTALSAIVASATHSHHAILFYEASVGLGFAIGPLAGGLLGEASWRGPFLGTATLMFIALIAIIFKFQDPTTAREDAVAEKQSTATIRLFDGVRGAFHPSMRWLVAGAFFYNFAFIMMLTYSPFPVHHAAKEAGVEFTPIHLGLVFFGWGIALALSSVFLAPRLADSFGAKKLTLWSVAAVAVVEVCMAFSASHLALLIVLVIVGGLATGTVNTLLTTASMSSTPLPRPVASSAYSGVRFIGSALAPTLVGPLEGLSGAAPLYAAGFAAAVACAILAVGFTLQHKRAA
ncbi:MFS transporter [Corynebacterium resistens]|uniref:MFS transporter n=1 Tax=Corynebacterium resistens TaxID=258224 RepID=UPI0005A78E89|nr:MFS transporter [Corynebacterium resistens]